MKKAFLTGCMALALAFLFCPLSRAEREGERNPIVTFFMGGGGSHRSGSTSGGARGIPEPGTMVLMATGIAALFATGKLRKRK